jgi:uncharacterized protein YoxC
LRFQQRLNSITNNPYFKSAEINLVFAESANLKSAIKKLQKNVEEAVKSGSSIIHLIEDLPETVEQLLDSLQISPPIESVSKRLPYLYNDLITELYYCR